MQMHLSTNMGCYSSTHLTRISTPRFLGKKRGKGLPLESPFQLYWWKERITLERWIFKKIEYSMVNSWKEGFINIFWAGKHETLEGMRRNGKVSSLVRKALGTVWIVLTNNIKGEHWRCNMVIARERSNLVCFLWKHGFSCRCSMYRTLFYDISISLLKTV
jgi:hypothetical protein